jgi:putative SOS response-associated peptidase YedK
MCNLYNFSRTQEEVRRIFPRRSWRDDAGNVRAGDVYPDQTAPIVHGDGEPCSAASPLGTAVATAGPQQVRH